MENKNTEYTLLVRLSILLSGAAIFMYDKITKSQNRGYIIVQ